MFSIIQAITHPISSHRQYFFLKSSHMSPTLAPEPMRRPPGFTTNISFSSPSVAQRTYTQTGDQFDTKPGIGGFGNLVEQYEASSQTGAPVDFKKNLPV